jgi:hypothetical protein
MLYANGWRRLPGCHGGSPEPRREEAEEGPATPHSRWDAAAADQMRAGTTRKTAQAAPAEKSQTDKRIESLVDSTNNTCAGA